MSWFSRSWPWRCPLPRCCPSPGVAWWAPWLQQAPLGGAGAPEFRGLRAGNCVDVRHAFCSVTSGRDEVPRRDRRCNRGTPPRRCTRRSKAAGCAYSGRNDTRPTAACEEGPEIPRRPRNALSTERSRHGRCEDRAWRRSASVANRWRRAPTPARLAECTPHPIVVEVLAPVLFELLQKQRAASTVSPSSAIAMRSSK